MANLTKIPSVILYDNHPILGERTINTLGAIRQAPPIEVRLRETALRLEQAERIAAILADCLGKHGLLINELSLTGSVATGFAGPHSDIDFVIKLNNAPLDWTPEYHKMDRDISDTADRAIHENETLRLVPYGINVHLYSTHLNDEYVRCLKREKGEFREERWQSDSYGFYR